MTRGAWILAAFIILGLAYALPSFSLFNWLPWDQASGWGKGIGIAAAVLSIIVPIYPGLLLGVIKSIPLLSNFILLFKIGPISSFCIDNSMKKSIFGDRLDNTLKCKL
jgi:formate-dependent nitrite reductase membrane component NrfD